MTDHVGQQFGNYRLLRLLGVGGFAEVYLAEHLHLGTQAAIKVLHTQLASEDLERFRTEARTIARLVHPNIIRVLEFGIEDKTPFLVMDYANNGSLHKLHPRGSRLPASTIVNYVKQIASALQYAHDEKVIHRDIKPENMLLGRRGEVLLSDFGIALIAQSSLSQRTQDIVGTIAYMAPEHIQGKPRLVSDQYSLGIVVYEWICGDRPFHGSFTELCTQHMFATPPDLRDKLPELPPAVEEVVMISLAKDPRERFSSILAFATAFEQACQQRTPYAITPSSDIVSHSLFPPSKNSIAPPPPDRIGQTANSNILPGQILPSSSIAIPSTMPGFYSPIQETKPTPVPLSSVNFSTPIPTISGPPVVNTASSTSKVPSSIYINTPVTAQKPVPKKRNSWKIAVAIVSLFLVAAVLLVLVLFSGQFRNQTTGHNDTRTPHNPTPTKIPLPPPPKFVYILSNVTNNGQSSGEILSAVRISDGTTLWRSQWNNESSYTQPVVSNGVAYFSTIHFNSSTDYGDGGAIHAIRANDGSTLWTYQVASANGVDGIYIADGIVYASADALYALRANDGSLLWKYQSDGEYMTVPSAVVNGVVYTVSAASSNHYCYAYAFRASDGTILWKYQMNESGSFFQPPVFNNGIVYITSPVPFRFFYPYDPSKDIHNINSAVFALRASDGSFLWKYEIDKESSFLKLEVINGVLYASSGSQRKSNGAIYALQASNGSLLWKYQVNVDNRYGGETMAIVTNGVVYIASQGSNATLYALRASDGTILWQYSLGNGYDPVINPTNDTVYVGISLGSSSVDALQVSNGSPLWSYQLTSGADLSTLVAVGTTLYVGIYGYNGPGSLLTLNINDGTLLHQIPGVSVSSMIAA